MTPPLFRVDAVPAVGETAVLDGAEGRHAGSALRVRPGELLRVGDGRGQVADCSVLTSGPGRVEAEVLARTVVERPTPLVTVVQALPKSDRSELAVELATEAGADRIVPWQADRCVSRWAGPKLDKGRTKWANAARAAAKQSRREWEPEIGDPLDSTGLVAFVAEEVRAGATALVLHEDGAAGFADAVTAAGPVERILLVVGPEGGVSDAEIDSLTHVGARAVVLGPEVLRTSSAAAVALGALGVLTRRWARTGTTLDPTAPPPRK
ncbi:MULTISPECIES: 16S rRNA (uracil(1498)-N(3))-methyltransferase [Dietzia]|uniref:Ribosomal RNA small subunit methyltransferase E n=4 Tax=Dietzia TaxID=37914 RepID=A0ABN2IL90_9ACTN|nr:16S rRNA (uracil(1498)-N(3))-methyltransferase [Dietzia cercidiphylli]MBB1040544.1 16S rRNA (uracil(1498)-N(3))-methyltransferase [Dietzia sp. Cai40]MBC7294990.1 16S rRNA (uracil(1498)-N(3))-methyltransferase [Dietzia sp.]MCT1514256.1 16S rRNA (uracil(1498)-N(3))-methyltransferase [Dietzia cercidiphylli]